MELLYNRRYSLIWEGRIAGSTCVATGLLAKLPRARAR